MTRRWGMALALAMLALVGLIGPWCGQAAAKSEQQKSDEAAGYPAAEIGRFAKLVTGWSKNQDVFAFFISGAKERNPAAAMALQDKLGITPAAEEGDAVAAGKTKASPAKSSTPVAAKKASASKSPVKKAPAKKK